MRSIAVVAASVVADAVRRRLVYVIIFFSLVLSLAIPYLPTFGVGVVEAVYREIALAVMFLAALVIAVALAATLVPADVEKRTAYAILTRPVTRLQYVVGIWLGLMVTLAWVLAAFTTIAQLAGLIAYGELYWLLWQGALAMWLEMGVVAAVALAVSTRASAVTAVLAALAFLFVGHSRGSLLTPDAGLAWSLYPSLDAFNVINPVAHGSGVSLAYVGGMLMAFAGWVAALLLVAGFVFGRRDL